SNQLSLGYYLTKVPWQCSESPLFRQPAVPKLRNTYTHTLTHSNTYIHTHTHTHTGSLPAPPLVFLSLSILALFCLPPFSPSLTLFGLPTLLLGLSEISTAPDSAFRRRALAHSDL